jgi:cysteine desulfurase/selenocysteine lyase
MKNNYTSHFPFFKNNPNIVYLDSAATTQKPRAVIDAVKNFYERDNANIHRGMYDLSQKATEQFEQVRGKVAMFIGASSAKEIVFTQNTTESINLVAEGWARNLMQRGDIVVLSEMEHNANVVPWMRLRDEIGIALFFLPIDADFRLVYYHNGSFFPDALLKKKEKIKFIALAHASNVLGTVNPITEIVSFCRNTVPNAKILLDVAQSIPHRKIDVKTLGVDFVAFSSHKLFGPTGVGVLWGKSELLQTMKPLLVGSIMVKKVTKEQVIYADIPQIFEAGTRNIEGVIGLGAAIDFVQYVGMKNIETYEKELTKYALQELQLIEGVMLFGPKTIEDRIGVFSFTVGKVHPHDVSEILNRSGIAVRSGHHCAHILMQRLGVAGTTRVSLSLYNTKEDIDALVGVIKEVKRLFAV